MSDRLPGSSWTNPIIYRRFMIAIGDSEFGVNYEAERIGHNKAYVTGESLPKIKEAIDRYWIRKVARDASRGIITEAPEE